MTAIYQNSITSHHSIDDAASHSDGRHEGAARDRQGMDNGVGDSGTSTVSISNHAQLRLKAYQEQRMMLIDQPLLESGQAVIPDRKASIQHMTAALPSEDAETNDHKHFVSLVDIEPSNTLERQGNNNDFPQNIAVMLSEVENNIVQTSEPGYQYLVNVLNNHMDSVENPQQLQEIMRKEQFFLTRRKPFMDGSAFQSYSQVLSQFANIVERQQFSL